MRGMARHQTAELALLDRAAMPRGLPRGEGSAWIVRTLKDEGLIRFTDAGCYRITERGRYRLHELENLRDETCHRWMIENT